MRLDARLIGNYVSAGRYYNELSQLLGKLLETQDHVQLGGRLAFLTNTDFFTLRLGTQLLYNTAHTLTQEDWAGTWTATGRSTRRRAARS